MGEVTTLHDRCYPPAPMLSQKLPVQRPALHAEMRTSPAHVVGMFCLYESRSAVRILMRVAGLRKSTKAQMATPMNPSVIGSALIAV